MARPGTQTAGDELAGLKLRTLAIAVAMAALLALGMALAGPALGKLLAPLLATLLGGSTSPVHVPSIVSTDDGRGPMVYGLFGLLMLLALFGYSTARFGRLSPWWLLLPLVLLLPLGRWLGLPPLPLHLIPGSVERATMTRQADEVDLLMTARGYGAGDRHYVLAQMAMRGNHGSALAKHGPKVLDVVDRFAYGHLDEAATSEALRFDPAIVAAIDRALHGEPLSEPGIRLADRSGKARPAADDVPWARLLAGIAALLGGLLLLRLWRTMQRRVVELALAAGQADPEQAARAGRVDTEPEAGHDDEAVAPAHHPLRHWRWVVAAAALWILWPAVVGLFHREARQGADPMDDKVLREELAATGLDLKDAHPCALIGAWNVSGRNVAYLLILEQDGRFQRTGLGAAPPPGATRGEWRVVDARRIQWTLEGPGHSQHVDTRIVGYDGQTFELLQPDGERLRHHFVKPRPGSCR